MISNLVCALAYLTVPSALELVVFVQIMRISQSPLTFEHLDALLHTLCKLFELNNTFPPVASGLIWPVLAPAPSPN